MAKEIITSALIKATGEEQVNLEIPQNFNHGDYSSNIALIRAKRQGKNPLEIAEIIKSTLSKDKQVNQIVSSIEIANPGFINFFLSKSYLAVILNKASKEADFGKVSFGKGKTALIEYSSPNIGKRFSLGHFRATIVGQAIYNLHKFSGYDVIGENHLGDWGTQFGTIIAQIVRKNVDVKSLSLADIERLYIDFNKEKKDNPGIIELARESFKKLEEGDTTARQIWSEVTKISLEEFNKIYKLLNVNIDNAHGESFYEDKMSTVISEAQKISKKGDSGAMIIETDNSGSPAMLTKSDGTTTYFTRDLTAIKYRINTWHPSKIIYEVGAEQSLHFQQVFHSAKMLWPEAKNIDFVHIAHGLIHFEGAKMSTRSGTNIQVGEVIKKAIEKARLLGSSEKVAKAVGIGALKYYDLMHNPRSSIAFDWDKAFVMEGKSGPYIQYTHARAKSVLSRVNLEANMANNVPDTCSPEEEKLLRQFSQFQDIITSATKNYSPNILAEYLFNLAQSFNNFYNNHKILNSESEQFRLAITKATANILKTGLQLLGINSPEKM